MPRIFCRDHLSVQNDHWRLSLPESFEAFYQGRSRNTRGNIRQYANRLKTGMGKDLSIRCFQEKGDVVRAMIDIETVARLTYQRGLSVGFRNTLETRRKWLLAAEKGRLRAYVLYVKNSPRAFWTGYLYKKIFYSDATGYDPALKYYHPGMFLLMRMVESFCLDKKVEGIDWGFGYVDYKRKYGSENCHESCVYIFAPSFKGLQLNVCRGVTTGLSQVAKIVLSRFDLLGVIKKWWRFRLTPG